MNYLTIHTVKCCIWRQHWYYCRNSGLICLVVVHSVQLFFFFAFTWRCIVTNFLIIKPNRRTNSTNLFWHETLHVSDSSSVQHQEFIHCTLRNGICHTAFEQDQDGTGVPSWSCSKAAYKPVRHIPFLSVQWINSWWWTE
jgi:hypothetical protein